MEEQRLYARFEKQPEADYHAFEAISAHGLKALLRSPAHYHSQFILKEDKPTAARRFGTLCHLYLLEAERFEALKAIEPVVDKRTKAGKAAYEEWEKGLPAGAIIFDQGEYDELRRIVENLDRHPVASNLLKSGEPELSGFWKDFDFDLPCKMRPDFLHHDGVIVDLKTCQDASYGKFQKAIINYRYDIQAAHYLTGYSVIMGKERDSVPFVFVAIETSAPYEVAVYTASQNMINVGRAGVRRGMERYKEALRSGTWAGYQTEAQDIDLPAWFKTE